MNNSPTPSPPPGYEATDATSRAIVLTGLGLLVTLGLILLVGGWIYLPRARRLPPKRSSGAEFSFRYAPDERTGIEADWAAQDPLVHERLETYGWINRDAGVVRIPIERAMEQLANRSGPTLSQPAKVP